MRARSCCSQCATPSVPHSCVRSCSSSLDGKPSSELMALFRALHAHSQGQTQDP